MFHPPVDAECSPRANDRYMRSVLDRADVTWIVSSLPMFRKLAEVFTGIEEIALGGRVRTACEARVCKYLLKLCSALANALIRSIPDCYALGVVVDVVLIAVSLRVYVIQKGFGS